MKRWDTLEKAHFHFFSSSSLDFAPKFVIHSHPCSLSLSLDFCRGLLGVLFLRSLHRLWIFVGVLASAPAVQAVRLFPRTAGERTKAAIRMNKPPVPSGRPVLPVTMPRRTQLPNEFFMWATEQGPDIAALLEHHQRHIDDINLVV